MGDDEAKKDKKRLKAEAKAEKKRAKVEKKKLEAERDVVEVKNKDADESQTKKEDSSEHQDIEVTTTEKSPWYKNPDWVRAVVGIATLIVTIIALLYAVFLA